MYIQASGASLSEGGPVRYGSRSSSRDRASIFYLWEPLHTYLPRWCMRQLFSYLFFPFSFTQIRRDKNGWRDHILAVYI